MDGLINLTHATFFPFAAALLSVFLIVMVVSKTSGPPSTVLIVILTAAIPVAGYAMHEAGIPVMANLKEHIELAVNGSLLWQVGGGIVVGGLAGMYTSYLSGTRKKNMKREEVDYFEEYPE